MLGIGWAAQEELPSVRGRRRRRRCGSCAATAFVCSYCSQRVIPPCVLQVFGALCPHLFPYHANWLMEQTHPAMMMVCGEIDHVDSWLRVPSRLPLGRAVQRLGVGVVVELFATVIALVPQEDRDPADRVFLDTGQARVRTAIARACKAAGVPRFSPHDLRHRRISLWHHQGVPGRLSAHGSVSAARVPPPTPTPMCCLTAAI